MQAVMGLRESSRDIFYGLLSQHIKEYLPVIYTPYATCPFPIRLGAITFQCRLFAGKCKRCKHWEATSDA